MLIVGYDIGSSSVKASLIDGESGEVISRSQYPSKEMIIDSPQVGWAEQDPNMWWEYVCEVTNLLFQLVPNKRKHVKAIGISYQMHGLVALDKNGKVLRPSIIWCDSRAVSIGEQAFQEIGEENCLSSMLNSPGNFTASKLKWVQQNEPHIYKQIHKIMLPGDYIAYRFTDLISTTTSGLSEGILWDFKNEKINETLLSHYEISEDLIPEIVPMIGNQGKLSREMIDLFGFHSETIVAYRAGDQPNNAFSLNVTKPGEIAATAGTSGVVYGIVDQLVYDVESKVNTFAHINHTKDEKKLGVLLCVNGTGSAYSWLRNQFFNNQSYLQLENQASSAPIGSDGLTFLPFGNGAERMLGNKIVGAGFGNLHFNRHQSSHMIRACLEGIAFALVYGMQSMKEMGVALKTIKAGNDNLFQSEIFSTIISSLTGTEIYLKETTGAVGAALGAGLGCGFYHSMDEVFVKEKYSKVYKPQGQDLAAFETAYENWKSHLALKIFKNES